MIWETRIIQSKKEAPQKYENFSLNLILRPFSNDEKFVIRSKQPCDIFFIFCSKVDEDDDLFFEVECHTLIGVANVYLECIFVDVPLDYAAPIISQQGEVWIITCWSRL